MKCLPQMSEANEEEIEQISANGAFDRRRVYQAIEKRKIKTGGNSAAPGSASLAARLPRGERLIRDENLRSMRRKGKPKWRGESQCHRRSLANTAMFRFKKIFIERVAIKKTG